MNDTDKQDSLLSDINDVLNKEIIEDWRRLASRSGVSADDPRDLRLELRYDGSPKGYFRFEFKVRDRSSDRGRFFNVTDRSKGLQWFFNFLMRLKFNPKYLDHQRDAIYLLDEPGSYLHSSAQEELLKALRTISETNTILYCTHSQHLLDPDIVNVARTRIVSKETAIIRVIPFGSANTSDYLGALTPLYNALHLRSGVFNRKIAKAVICEGITDYYFFKMLTEFSAEFDFDVLDFIPGSGAGHLKDLISMCIAWADDFVVLLDSDDAGTKARDRYERFFGAQEARRFIHYSMPGQSDNVTLESFLSQDDAARVLELTGAKHLKSGIIELYYESETARGRIFRALDQQTIVNLSQVKMALTRLQSGVLNLNQVRSL